MSILIRNGRIITAADNYEADIFIADEQITTIGKDLTVTADRVIDARDNIIFPGGIDPHVHLDMPFMGAFSSDNFESGTRAALFGGTTTVIDFVIQKKGDTLYNALEEWRRRSDGNTYGDYAFHFAITDFNEKTRDEIKQMILDEGITSFKAFMAYKGSLMIDDGQMMELMTEIRENGGVVSVHATNGGIIDYLVAKHKSEGKLSPLYHYLSQPEVTEAEATGRFTDMANYTGVNAYVVHLTCEGALNHIRDAGKRNQKVFAETCIQYLLLDASLYEKGFEAAKWVMSPPLREKKDQLALWAGINQGLVQTIATDHCPFMWEHKKMGKNDFSKIPNGYPGIEHRVELMYSEGVHKKRISENKFVEVTSTNAAKIFGMYPKKGTIAVGSDADLVIFDPNKQHVISARTHHMNCDYSGFEGREVNGKCKTVLVRGKVAVDNNECFIRKGYGKFIRRNPTPRVI